MSYNRCHILSEEKLKRFGARSLYMENNNGTTMTTMTATRMPPSGEQATTSKVSIMNTGKNSVPKKQPIGISINDWDILSHGQSSIASEHEIDALTTDLQSASISSTSHDAVKATKPKRLCPPEIVFLHSFVSLTYQKREILRFDAKSALLDWARAHQYLVGHPKEDDTKNESDGGVYISSSSSYRGVSVIQTKDAQLWKEKRKKKQHGSCTKSSFSSINSKKSHDNKRNMFQETSMNIGTSSEFYFDWTYSTPYAGSLYPPGNSVISNTEAHPNWKPISASGIQPKLHLLTDRTQPILFFHENTFYEDDMHDNGDVSLSTKIRVMPKCFFLLCRLYVRVDHVLIRCRDTRILYEYPTNSDCTQDIVHVIYRDITWREAKWEELASLGLPTDIRMWRSDDANSLQSMLNQLPLISLPDDLSAFSLLEVK